MQKVQWYILIGIVAVLVSTWIYLTRVPMSAASIAPLVGSRAPEFSIAALGGQPVSLSDLRGRVILINFWATWCVPCRAEMPALQAAYEEHSARGLVVLAINEKEDADSVAQFADEVHLTFPILLDLDGTLANRYQARALPTSFFIDREGMIQAVSFGEMKRAYIETEIATLLGEDPSPTAPLASAKVAVPTVTEPPDASAAAIAATPIPPSNPSSSEYKVNLDEIFPSGKGRDLAFENCTTCHAINFLAFVRKTNARWQTNRENHKQRFPSLTSADFETMYSYLMITFDTNVPLPKLPSELWAPCDT